MRGARHPHSLRSFHHNFFAENQSVVLPVENRTRLAHAGVERLGLVDGQGGRAELGAEAVQDCRAHQELLDRLGLLGLLDGLHDNTVAQWLQIHVDSP